MFAPYQNAYQNPYGQQLAQNRLNQMEQQYNTMPTGFNANTYNQAYQMQPQTQQQYIKGRPVSSFDEAKAIAIDWDGSIFVFTDVANKRIYTKQIMLDGTAELKTYTLEEDATTPTQAQSQANSTVNGEYVLRSDFESQMERMQSEIEELKKGGNLGEPVRSNAKSNVRKQSGLQKSAGDE